uniref:Uncharacterized protein AlNc14C37G3259 n=1 Tax=Albugo laibachii Nc14 TaxID=890382 RepID=F0W8Y4_9STRA|nr:conserved hypothetical protein [Albugo laibachii Nc14]|eukprot:CCA17595.1 conserved hypothetical protein [Albugo laibachii Nc14]
MHKNTQPAAPLPLLGERISTSVSPNSTIQNTRKRAVFVTDAYFTLFSHQIHQNQCPRSISDSPRASIPHKSLYKASPKLPSSSSHLIITVYSCIMALPSSTPASISAHHIAENLHRRISQLTIDQHVTLLSLHAKMNQALERGLPRVLALSPVEMETYSHLLVLATAEQNEVIETLKNLSRKLASYDPECHTQRYANAWYALWNQQLGTQLKQSYPEAYQNIAECTLRDPNGTFHCHKLSHVKKVAVYGSPYTVSWEFIQTITSLPQIIPMTSDWLQDCPISTDPIASKLMVEHKCDVAMSTDTLCELLDNDTVAFRNPSGWVLPVRKRVTTDPSLQTHTFIDPPLPVTQSLRDKVLISSESFILNCIKVRHPSQSLTQLDSFPQQESLKQNSSPSTGQTSYHIWELQGHRILLRHRQFLTIHNPSKPHPPSESQPPSSLTHPIRIAIKVDQDFLHLPEQLSPREQCRLRLDSWLHGGIPFAFARVFCLQNRIEWLPNHIPSASLDHTHMSLFNAAEYVSLSLSNISLSLCSVTESFQSLDRVLLFLSSFPAGMYLLQAPMNALSQLSLYRESTDSSDSQSLDSFLKLAGIQAEIDLIPPEWTPQCDRFPYSFRTFSYCQSYLTAGVCVTENCDSVHLRLSREKGILFDDSKVLQSVRNRGRRMDTCQVSYCREIGWNANRLHARVTCSSTCSSPHLTLHQVLERVADQIVREERAKVRQRKRRQR